MIRLVHCIRSRPELTLTEFRQHFHGDAFRALLQRLADLSGAIDFHTSLTLNIELNTKLRADRGGEEPFDAIVEVRWSNGQDLMRCMETDEAQALIGEMDAIQAEFIDFARSARFFTED